MSREAFETIRFQKKSLTLIEQANAIIAEYVMLGFVLTLRQLFYQFVSRRVIENIQSEYKRLAACGLNDTPIDIIWFFVSSRETQNATISVCCASRKPQARQAARVVVKNGCRAGLIDWNAIEDRTRNRMTFTSWESPGEIVRGAARQYREDLWLGQRHRPEVWIKKDALIGVIEGVCGQFRIPYLACRGNTSESELYAAGKRFELQIARGLIPVVLHLGDHDPNGLDMTRDNRDRLAMFAQQGVEVRRLALNIDQVERYRPPPNFAKETDSRFEAYAAEFGQECWELDALNPTVIADLIRMEVEGLIDVETWNSALAQERANRAVLNDVSRNWSKNFLRRRPAAS